VNCTPDKVSGVTDCHRHRQKNRAWRFSNDRIVAAIDRKRAIGLLASREGHSYNTGIASRASQPQRGSEENTMDKFEEIGQKLDEELTRLRKFVENDLAPETEKRTAQFLREVSEKLTEAAGWLEARRTGRTPPDEKKPAA
jgi:hypothetical protein